MDTTIAQPTCPVNVNGHLAPATIPQGPALLPEAPCSITMRVPMPGYSDHALITGRGQTGVEAAAQWQAARQALLAVVTTPAPLPPRTERLAQLLTKGLACAAERQDSALMDRLAKATYLVLTNAIEPTDRAQALAVRSMQHPDTWYTVEAGHCSCPAMGHHPEIPCKHALGVALWQRLAAQEAAYTAA